MLMLRGLTACRQAFRLQHAAPVARLFSSEVAQPADVKATEEDAPEAPAPPLPAVKANVPFPRFVVKESKAVLVPVAFSEALSIVKRDARAKFDETLEIAINLGVDPKRGDQNVRGSAVLPHGSGKTIRVAVFAEDMAVVEAAHAAGADVVGGQDLINEIQKSGGSSIAFDKAIAHPDIMPKLSQVARILGPKGMMPNPKVGTVTANVVEAVEEMRKGRVEYRSDKGGVLHAPLGKLSFESKHLEANAGALMAALLAARPKGVKGAGASGYMLKATMSSTMGKGVPVTISSCVALAGGK